MNASPAQFSNKEPGGLPENIRSGLSKVIEQDLCTRMAMFPVLLGIILPLLWLVRAGVDRIFGLSWTVRLILLLVDVSIVGFLFYRHVYLPYKRRLNLSTAALLVERRMPEFRTSLISAVELSATEDGSGGLARGMIASVGKRVAQVDIVRGVSDKRQLKRWGKWSCLVLLSVGFAAWYTAPASAILGQRVFLANSALPALTKVLPLTQNITTGVGSDVELSARAEGVVPRTGKLIVDHEDGRAETVTVSQRENSLFAYTVKNVRSPFRYHFEINDGKSDQFAVALKIVPSLSAITFTQVYPKYVGLPETVMQPGSLRLLSGSLLKIKAESASELKSATLELTGLGQKIPMKIVGERKRETEVEIPVETGITGLSIHLEDLAGEHSENDPAYRVQILTDKAPTVSLTEPKTEKFTVVVDDRVAFAYAARDDYGIQSIVLAYEVLRINPDGQLALAERGKIPLEVGPNPLSARGSFSWDLTTLMPPLTVGSAILCWVEARDFNTAASSGKSKSRRLLVVSEEGKKNELIKAMQDKARIINSISEGQGTINQKTDDAIRSK